MSAQGQQLQARFVESYADRLHDDIEGKLTLPEFAPVSRPAVASPGDVRARGPSGGGGSGNLGAAPDPSGIRQEVRAAQTRGRGRIDQSRGNLDAVTQGARSEEHTSELQSIMRISCAVLCLNKNNNAI